MSDRVETPAQKLLNYVLLYGVQEWGARATVARHLGEPWQTWTGVRTGDWRRLSCPTGERIVRGQRLVLIVDSKGNGALKANDI